MKKAPFKLPVRAVKIFTNTIGIYQAGDRPQIHNALCEIIGPHDKITQEETDRADFIVHVINNSGNIPGIQGPGYEIPKVVEDMT